MIKTFSPVCSEHLLEQKLFIPFNYNAMMSLKSLNLSVVSYSIFAADTLR